MPREQRVGGLNPALEARFGTTNLSVYPAVYPNAATSRCFDANWQN